MRAFPSALARGTSRLSASTAPAFLLRNLIRKPRKDGASIPEKHTLASSAADEGPPGAFERIHIPPALEGFLEPLDPHPVEDSPKGGIPKKKAGGAAAGWTAPQPLAAPKDEDVLGPSTGTVQLKQGILKKSSPPAPPTDKGKAPGASKDAAAAAEAPKAPSLPAKAPSVPPAPPKGPPKEVSKDVPAAAKTEPPKEAPKEAVKQAPKEALSKEPAKEAPQSPSKEAPKEGPPKEGPPKEGLGAGASKETPPGGTAAKAAAPKAVHKIVIGEKGTRVKSPEDIEKSVKSQAWPYVFDSQGDHCNHPQVCASHQHVAALEGEGLPLDLGSEESVSALRKQEVTLRSAARVSSRASSDGAGGSGVWPPGLGLGLTARQREEEKAPPPLKDWLSGQGLAKFGLMKSAEGIGWGASTNVGSTDLASLAAVLAKASASSQASAAKEPEAKAKPKEEAKKEAPKKGPPKAGPPGKGPGGGKGPPKPPPGKRKGPGAKKAGGLKKREAFHVKKEDVEETFAKLAPKAKTEVKKPKVLQLLPDSKRAYNMNIALAKFSNYSYQELREAIIDLSPKILTVEATESLLNFVPTPEETAVMKEYISSGGDLKLVDRPEQFVAAMMGIPLMRQRLDAHLFALNFAENYKDAYNPVSALSESCDAVRSCKNLKSILFAVLELGNMLNEGDPQRGNADGFKPTTLAKLTEVRSTTKPIRTLLQYLCDVIWEQNPSILDIYNELKICEKGQKVDVGAIEGKIVALKQGVAKVKNTVEAARKGNEASGVLGDKDPLATIMDEFVEEALPKVTELERFLKESMEDFNVAVRYLGYPEKDMKKVKPDEFFKQVASFVRNIEAARKAKQELLERERKKAEAASKKAAKGGLSKR
ncbi:protein cappuccino [Cyclospora cayetanensis]|uniref:Protein cappuccino n=1 Tax=Cyclospora cayetanensis TaxID=88456 RepID=A0A6P6RUL5_9EIME|nr:protein cappuccino [Cyclospora cayetanensis]